jgi:hypothetical protein
MEGRNAQLEHEVAKMIYSQCLSEDVGELVSGSNMVKLKETLLDLFANEVAVNFNVFRPLMEYRIAGNV